MSSLINGDSLKVLQQYEDNTFDLIVTDPPYGISFMGKDWDKALPDKRVWQECYRTLKDGKFAFIMCSPRQDVLSRMIISLEDAGFRTNYTSIYWTYASGFPKAANVSKLIDKKWKRNKNQDCLEFKNYIRSKLTKTKTVSGFNKLLQDKGLISPKTVIRSHYFGNNNNQPTIPTFYIYQTMKEYLGLDDRFDYLIKDRPAPQTWEAKY